MLGSRSPCHAYEFRTHFYTALRMIMKLKSHWKWQKTVRIAYNPQKGTHTPLSYHQFIIIIIDIATVQFDLEAYWGTSFRDRNGTLRSSIVSIVLIQDYYLILTFVRGKIWTTTFHYETLTPTKSAEDFSVYTIRVRFWWRIPSDKVGCHAYSIAE